MVEVPVSAERRRGSKRPVHDMIDLDSDLVIESSRAPVPVKSDIFEVAMKAVSRILSFGRGKSGHRAGATSASATEVSSQYFGGDRGGVTSSSASRAPVWD